jgi:uncharacterized integral membrane protein
LCVIFTGFGAYICNEKSAEALAIEGRNLTVLLFAVLMLFNLKAVKVDLKTTMAFAFPFVAFMDLLAVFSAVSAMTV